jgi:hypothetical protein
LHSILLSLVVEVVLIIHLIVVVVVLAVCVARLMQLVAVAVLKHHLRSQRVLPIRSRLALVVRQLVVQ